MLPLQCCHSSILSSIWNTTVLYPPPTMSYCYQLLLCSIQTLNSTRSAKIGKHVVYMMYSQCGCHCRSWKDHQTACERRPRYDRHSCTNRLLWYYPMLVTVHSIIITPLTTTGTLTVYVDRLKRVYQNPPTTWLPLPNCKHIKLAVTKEKGNATRTRT